MLQKTNRSNSVDKLQTIQLFEADYNLNNKKIRKEVMMCAETNNLLPEEQYGSRKCKSTVEHALNKCLTLISEATGSAV